MLLERNTLTKEELREIIKSEPVFKKMEYNGYIYEIIRMKPLLHYCGYVYIPNGNRESNGKFYHESKVFCHGGITYYDNQKIGFDTAHFQDLVPKMFFDYSTGYGTYKDINFCVAECESIIDQLIELNK